MNILTLSFKNWRYFAKEHILSIILIATSIALIIINLQINQQIQKRFEKNLAGIDMVLAAKGSPLQIILSSMYHIDAPTGNIALEDVKAFFREDHPYIKTAVPLGLGDSYRSYRVVGTTKEFYNIYPLEISEGEDWQEVSEVCIGYDIAQTLGLKVGDHIQTSHGYNVDDMTHDHSLKIVGIYEQTGSVVDQLVVTSIQTIWDVHSNHSESHHDHDHTHSVRNNQEMLHFSEQDITSVLIDFKKNSPQTLQWPRQINENTSFQAVTPAMEAARLYDIIGRAGSVAEWIGRGLLLISLLSLILSLLINFDRRKSQIAILRMIGMTFIGRMSITVIEVLWTLVCGVTIGFVLGHFSIYLLSQRIYNNYKISLEPLNLAEHEIFIMILFIVIGIITAVIPAWRASQSNIDLLLKE